MEGKQVSDRVPRYSEARLYNNAATARTTARRVSSRNYVSSECAQIGRKKTREAYSACAPIYARARGYSFFQVGKRARRIRLYRTCPSLQRGDICMPSSFSFFFPRFCLRARYRGKGPRDALLALLLVKITQQPWIYRRGGERLDDSSKVSCPAVALLCRSIEREFVEDFRILYSAMNNFQYYSWLFKERNCIVKAEVIRLLSGVVLAILKNYGF